MRWFPIGDRILYAVHRELEIHPYSLPPGELEKLWLHFRSQELLADRIHVNNLTQDRINMAQFGMLQVLSDRYDRLEGRVTSLEKTVFEHDETLRLLENLLPTQLAVTQVDGKLTIPQGYWSALLEVLASPDSAPMWNAFLKANEHNLQHLWDAEVASKIDDLAGSKLVVSRQEFTQAMAENKAWFSEHFSEEMRRFKIFAATQAEQAVKEALPRARDLIFSQHELATLAIANSWRNAEEARREVNFFATGLGARIDVFQTSKTWVKPQAKWYQVGTRPHPPVVALQRWEEASDCWCASPSTDLGKAQITVMLPHAIYASRLVIEHIPSQGTLNISSAPYIVEIWQVPSNMTAKQAKKKIDNAKDSWREGDVELRKKGPSSAHVAIGAGRYDIHTLSNVQSIPMFVNLEDAGVPSKKFTIRITENWGGLSTCIYRLRMTGQRVEE
ncbi:hypothetical protein BAUCODRAFT_79747 [Baudoinia panamericana UAMH 10762]|uniref:SUN domain-containing protein n=1 Tax=Baudoinia panamericana (strain UAMH 10762) TaxID=717646 RepID=M2MZ72_BAUPA|nr:uncharacterized protein BAUCODRAFT_79747 [Baudoinia panamericana UAMH 10762]EMC91974.1 hypothetical protein BAUCODRAFT_79747 [Baudoinia panamericana UAMH 10762]